MAADNSMSPVRFLVVENDPQQRADIIETLKGWDYECYAAEAPADAEDAHSALLEDAILTAHRYRCHLALVDMRLRDDSDTTDTSGLALVSKLAPTISIILSGKGDRKTVRAALKPSLAPPARAYDFVGKEDGPEALREAILGAMQQIWHQRDIEFVRSKELESRTLINRFFPRNRTVPRDEVDDLLRRLFPDAKRLRIEATGASQRTLGLHLRRHSIVLKITEDDHSRPVIVKVARTGRIGEEIQRFTEAKKHFTSGRYAQPRGTPIELWDIGGTIYELIGDDEDFPYTTFSEYYKTHEYQDIGQVIENLDRLWKPLYKISPEKYGQKRIQTIIKAYNQVWGNDWFKRVISYRNHGSVDYYPYPFQQIDLLNPLNWLIRKIHLSDKGRYRDEETPDTDIAYTHGDLHSDNFFVDKRHDVWLIDYERTGFGPILQDWVELENDTLTHLAELNAPQDWSAYYQLLVALLSDTSIQPSKDRDFRSLKFDKEWKSINEIRRFAHSSSGIMEGTAYLWGLLLNALFRLTLLLKEQDEWIRTKQRKTKVIQQTLNPPQKLTLGIQRSLLLAGLLCHRLDHWNDEWPPKEWAGLISSLDTYATKQHPIAAATGDYALLIGVGNTPNEPHLSLPTTVKDAEALRIVLKQAGTGFPASNVSILCNETATLPRILEALKWLADQATANPDSTVIVYFSGHGGRLQDSQDYFLVPSDIDPGRLKETVLWSSEFTEQLRAIKAKRLLVLIDACHAAGMASAKDSTLLQEYGFIEAAPPDSLLREWKQLPASGSKQADSTPRQGEGRAVISSCRSDQSSYIRKDGKLSIFTHHLSEALTGQANRSGETGVTVTTLIQHLGKTVPESAQRDYPGTEQNPWTDYEGEDFQVVASSAETKVAPDIPSVVMPKPTPERPDFLLVTALREEHDCLLRGLPGNRKLPPAEDDIATCYQVDLPVVSPDQNFTGVYRTIIMPLMAMGRVKAATATANAISRWHPRYIILIGIAGGIAAQGVRIGDVLISDKIVDYELQKITTEGPEIRYDVHQADPRLLNACQNYTVENWSELVQTRRPARGKPTLYVGPIASGDKVVSFAVALTRYRTAWPKLIGVEMEAAGVATAAFQSSNQPGFFMIRCVSDLADENKNSAQTKRWRTYACDVAASYAIALLRSGPVPFAQ